jgi:alpha/beta superfamily hydrolase
VNTLEEMQPGGAIESIDLAGEAGRLEALLNHGAEGAKWSALVCHPHPLYGGAMHNKVVYQTMKVLNGFGLPVLRFNYRGVGRSEGEHDRGRGELADTRVALDYLAQRFSRPVIFAGNSFGAAVGTRAAAAHPAVKAMIALGLPLAAEGRDFSFEALVESTKPKLLVSGDDDEFASVEGLLEMMRRLKEPKRLALIEGCNHFFTGHLEDVRAAVTEWVGEIVKA